MNVQVSLLLQLQAKPVEFHVNSQHPGLLVGKCSTITLLMLVMIACKAYDEALQRFYAPVFSVQW